MVVDALILLLIRLEKCSLMQIKFNPADITAKTMKTLDRAARLAMLPDCEIYCVDLTEGIGTNT
jgi:hypothetical protein